MNKENRGPRQFKKRCFKGKREYPCQSSIRAFKLSSKEAIAAHLPVQILPLQHQIIELPSKQMYGRDAEQRLVFCHLSHCVLPFDLGSSYIDRDNRNASLWLILGRLK